jgi:ribulose-phosphate 3-epimerase
MSIVVPAILPKSRKDLEEKLSRLTSLSSIEAVQIDVVDGHFAAPATWPYVELNEFAEMVTEGTMLPLYERFRYDIDLMVNDPAPTLGVWISLGASRLTIHAESTTNLQKILADLKQTYGREPGLTEKLLSIGLAIQIETDLALLQPYLKDIEYVQFMGIARIGVQGQPFDARVLSKISEFRNKNPNILIQVDGGVSLDSAPLLLKAGVDRLIIGSALFKASDIEAEIKKFEQLDTVHGVYERS